MSRIKNYEIALERLLNNKPLNEFLEPPLPLNAIQSHGMLNPKIWNPDDTMKPEVREQLMKIVNGFIQWANLTVLEIEDVVMPGSNANFDYSTTTSDIDIHIVFSKRSLNQLKLMKEVRKDIMNTKKNTWNNQTAGKLTVVGIPVEITIEDPEERPVYRNGVFSIYKNEWIQKPYIYKIPKPDTITVKKANRIVKQIKKAIKSKDPKVMRQLLGSLSRQRTEALKPRYDADVSGEFTSMNQAYKIVRAAGWMDRLRKALTDATISDLSS